MAHDRLSLATAVDNHDVEPPPPFPGPSAGGAAGAPGWSTLADDASVPDPVPCAGGALPAGAVAVEAALAPDICPSGDNVPGVPAPIVLAAAAPPPDFGSGGKRMSFSSTSPECLVDKRLSWNDVANGVPGAAVDDGTLGDGVDLALARTFLAASFSYDLAAASSLPTCMRERRPRGRPGRGNRCKTLLLLPIPVLQMQSRRCHDKHVLVPVVPVNAFTHSLPSPLLYILFLSHNTKKQT